MDYQTTPIHEGFYEQPPPYDQIHFWTLHQEISVLDMKIHIGADLKLSTALFRKRTDYAALLHFHSNHSLRCKESIVFSKAITHPAHNFARTSNYGPILVETSRSIRGRK